VFIPNLLAEKQFSTTAQKKQLPHAVLVVVKHWLGFRIKVHLTSVNFQKLKNELDVCTAAICVQVA
jgi:hypothetical protein